MDQTPGTEIWLSYIRDQYTPKNLFQKDVLAFAKNYDRLLTTDPQQWIAGLKQEIEAIHERHKRCKILRVSHYNYGRIDGDDVNVAIGDLMYFRLIKVSGRHTKAGVQPFLPFEKGGVES